MQLFALVKGRGALPYAHVQMAKGEACQER